MASTNSLYGLFPGPDSADRGVRALRAAGVPQEKILVMSSEPYEEYSFTRAEHKTLMPWLATAGGLVGGTCGYLLARLTQVAYPITVGNMPRVSQFPTAIVTYELTMFGAVLATVITLLVTARLARKRPEPYDPEISNGKILIGVVDPADSARAQLENSLRQAGADEIKSTGSR
ncbi:MAG: quinol:electron acceptor oxidoreductase subunit ActD [Candidatus Acidiferrales bacterium]